MTQRVLDANRLIGHWNRSWAAAGRRPPTIAEARHWARELCRLRGSKAIVTPVQIEFIAGARNSTELNCMRAFLEEFVIVDQGKILPQDCERALALAARVPASGRPRSALDCLIRAIADRLNYDVDTADSGMPRSQPPPRTGPRAGRRRRG